MKTDLELESWRQEWRDQTEPLPQLKKKIRRQNLRTAAAVIAIVCIAALSTVEALRTHSSLVAGFAVGLVVASVCVGSFAWWVRRGAWKPAAQTTLAYAELSYKRAVSRARTLNFAFYFLLITVVLFAAFSAWNWRNLHVRDGAVLAALVLELFFLRHYEKRKRREIEETTKLIENIQE